MHPVVLLACACAASLFVSACRPSAPAIREVGSSTVWTLVDTTPVPDVRTEVLGTPTPVEIDGVRALRFDGVDDALVLHTNPIAGMDAFTIEMLVRPDTGGPFEQRFLHIAAADDHRMLFELRMPPDGSWYLDTFLRAVSSSRTLIDPTKLHPPERWTWVAMTYADGRAEHFVEGTSELADSVDFVPMPGGATSIGMRMNRVSWFRGAIAEVRFHRGVLPPEALQRSRPPGAD
ncbi:LamG domain-containing protein [Opitutales bacterium ASA1]|uniref:LamG domain-containing protein n=1 Tax=Congregicoccus parvus TaxID=3081749 RepID=UPI002B2DED3F|nr:LamG domain-containing protein [Opitutales bacterium ASA1]